MGRHLEGVVSQDVLVRIQYWAQVIKVWLATRARLFFERQIQACLKFEEYKKSKYCWRQSDIDPLFCETGP